MTLATAIELVVADTREGSNASLTDAEAIKLARTLDVLDLDVVEDIETRSAYHAVLVASDADIA